MCGIVGLVGKQVVTYKDTIEKMKLSISHRGPDGDGTEVYENCIFGHVRLSIIDLVGGKQPMHSQSRQNCITFNGEIYNYLELEKNLSYDFQTRSDTEVLLALYKQEDRTFVKKLKGMFAFALWDEEKQRLFCARDRFGEKPFYYAQGRSGEFIFASEIKAIVASGLVDLTLNKKSLAHYLQKLYVPVDKTIYENIHTLPPAHQLTYEKGRVKIKKYWNLPEEENISLGDALEKFSLLFDNAVKRQLIADVETGAFLSGGLDSSTIVAIASKYNHDLKTFSFGFDGNNSELPFAKEVAKLYQTKHFEFIDQNQDLSRLLIQMQTIFDEPFADSSNIPTYIISKHAREHVKVVLSGDGGDELLGGYDFWYKPLYHMQQTKDPSVAKYFLARLARKIGKTVPYLKNEGVDSYIEGVRLNQRFSSLIEAKQSQNHYFSDEELMELRLSSVEKELILPINETLNDVLKIDILDYMPGDVLPKVDRVSMANGLEVRAPFLDPDFASFCISLPSSLKVSSTSDKIILREAFKELWPESVQKRSKQGFGAPVQRWLKQPNMKQLKNEFLEDKTKKIYSVMEYAVLKQYIQEDSYKTWIILVLSIWMETHEFEYFA